MMQSAMEVRGMGDAEVLAHLLGVRGRGGGGRWTGHGRRRGVCRRWGALGPPPGPLGLSEDKVQV